MDGAKHETLFRLVQGFYWLFLGAWFGGLVVLSVAAGVTFATLRAYEPVVTVPPYNDPVIAGESRGTLILGGGVVGNVITGVAVFEAVCAAVVLGCMAMQHTVLKHHLSPPGVRLPANVLRTLAIVAATIILAVQVTWISPTIWRERQIMYDPARPRPEREEAAARLERVHHTATRLVGTQTLLLAGAALLSAFVLHGPGRDAAEERKSPTA